MTYRNRRKISISVAVLASAALIAGCASTAGPGATGASDKSTGAESVSFGLSRQLTGLNPHKGGSPDSDQSPKFSIYERLVTTNPQEEIQPQLAVSWEEVDDVTWVFQLREDVTFSDGSELTAEDVAWNFEELLDEDTDSNAGVNPKFYIASVEATGDHEVTFHLKQKNLNLLQNIKGVGITKKDFWESGNVSLEALGTGPYELVSIDLENNVVLERRDDYWGEEPTFENVEYKVLPTEAQRIAALKSGEIDLALNLNPSSLSQFDGEEFDTTIADSGWTQIFAINQLKEGPLQDVRVRKALNHAIDKEGIIESLFQGVVDPLPGTLITDPFYDVSDFSPYEYDPEKAKELLDEAGYSDGIQLELAVSEGTYLESDAVAQIVQSQFEAVGVELTITLEQFPAWVQRQFGDNAADLTYVGWGGGYKNDVAALNYLQSKSIYQQSNWEFPEYDAEVAKARSAKNEDELEQHINTAARLFGENATIVFLWDGAFTAVSKPYLDWEPRVSRNLYAQEVGLK